MSLVSHLSPRGGTVWVIWALVTVSAIVVLPGLARSEQGGLEALARQHHEQGIELFRQGQHEKALQEFAQAQELTPTPSNLNNMAKCLGELGRVAEAIEMMDRFLATPDLAIERRRRAQQYRDELSRRPALLSLGSEPAGAQVRVDGASRPGATVTPAEVELAPGEHHIELGLDGYETARRIVTLEPGARSTLQVTLRSPTSPEPPPEPPEPPEPTTSGSMGSGATLVVENVHPQTRYLFVDGAFIGTIPAGGRRSLDISPGTHRLVSADSPDPDDDPSTEVVSFGDGSVERWRITAEDTASAQEEASTDRAETPTGDEPVDATEPTDDGRRLPRGEVADQWHTGMSGFVRFVYVPSAFLRVIGEPSQGAELPSLANPAAGIAFVARRNGFEITSGLWWAGYRTDEEFLWGEHHETEGPYFRDWSSYSALLLTVDLLWSFTVTDWLSFFVGFGLGMAIEVGDPRATNAVSLAQHSELEFDGPSVGTDRWAPSDAVFGADCGQATGFWAEDVFCGGHDEEMWPVLPWANVLVGARFKLSHAVAINVDFGVGHGIMLGTRVDVFFNSSR